MIEASVARELLDAYRIDAEYELYVAGECGDADEWYLIIDKEN